MAKGKSTTTRKAKVKLPQAIALTAANAAMGTDLKSVPKKAKPKAKPKPALERSEGLSPRVKRRGKARAKPTAKRKAKSSSAGKKKLAIPSGAKRKTKAASGVRGKQRFLNRELSWLEFNQRVLEEAKSPSVPLLERLKFLAITAGNLDEFFMVRVGGLQLLAQRGYAGLDPAGYGVVEQLTRVLARTQQMVREQYAAFLAIEALLVAEGLARLRSSLLSPEQSRFLSRFFELELLPLLTPVAIEAESEFPTLPSLTLHLYLRLQPKSGGERSVILTIPRSIPRFITVPSSDGHAYILVEEVVTSYLHRLFPGEEVLESVPFRITRNADMELNEDPVADLLQEMEDLLVERTGSSSVRLEILDTCSSIALDYLQSRFSISAAESYPVPGPLDLAAFMAISQLPGFDGLRDVPWLPQLSPQVDPQESLFSVISRQDILLFHPYESFEPVVRFLQEAALDPEVLAIKQILYRTSRESPIIAALDEAARRGKQVTAIVELKARFDEARNIDWARALERAGVQVIYGIRRLKTHAKLCIVLRRGREGIRRFLHFSTGNYNETTAQTYSDVGYLTSDDEYGIDASAFFNAITGLTQPAPYRLLASAPSGLRERILGLISSETERCRQGQKGLIMAKLNSLVDPEIIKALCKASQAGVKVLLNVRGICCLRPGLRKVSENITVVSIIDRFLEHARILYFAQGGEPKVFISSADWMPRNLDRRIELLIPIRDLSAQTRLIEILRGFFQDTVKSWQLLPTGQYERVRPGRKRKVLRVQELLYHQAVEASEQSRQADRNQFQPYRSPQAEP
ncbi:MAG: polyphosphate kinase 1 [Coprothermobacterota bacterium]|nr:polyphosphate kinase 1 [Coprothermobacterota bacterium]